MAATKVNTGNIFASLQDDSDNEGPVVVAPKATSKAPAAVATQSVVAKPNKEGDNRRAPRGLGRGQGRAPRKEGDAPAAEGAVQNKDNNQRPKHSREGPRTKGVPAEPHPQDRKSGNGVQAFGRGFRKEGGGRGNYGTVKNEVDNVNKEQAPKPVEEEVVTPVEIEEPEVVDNTITVEEYFQRLGVTNDAPVTPVVERTLNLDELKREKLQVVSSRANKVLDGSNAVKKSAKAVNKNNTTYLLGCNTDHSDLLGLKTGHTLVKYTVKKEGQEIIGEEKKTVVSTQQAPRNTRQQQPHQPKTVKKNLIESEVDFPKLA